MFLFGIVGDIVIFVFVVFMRLLNSQSARANADFAIYLGLKATWCGLLVFGPALFFVFWRCRLCLPGRSFCPVCATRSTCLV
jgi:hypothetical protein